MMSEVLARIQEQARIEVEQLLLEHPGHADQKVHGHRGGFLVDKAIEQGGFTYNPVRMKDRIVKAGFMVSTRPDAQVYAELTDKSGYGSGREHARQMLYQYIDKYRKDIKAEGHYLGGWTTERNGKKFICFDIAERAKADSDAADKGIGANQDAVWDVRQKREIWMPGRKPAEQAGWVWNPQRRKTEWVVAQSKGRKAA